MTNDPFEVADPSGLSDADWADINRLRRIYKTLGKDALSDALAELAKDPARYVHILGAIFPEMIREAIRDEMAAAGMDEDDLRELVRKLESPAGTQ